MTKKELSLLKNSHGTQFEAEILGMYIEEFGVAALTKQGINVPDKLKGALEKFSGSKSKEDECRSCNQKIYDNASDLHADFDMIAAYRALFRLNGLKYISAYDEYRSYDLAVKLFNHTSGVVRVK